MLLNAAIPGMKPSKEEEEKEIHANDYFAKFM